jgi:hypothetical protein
MRLYKVRSETPLRNLQKSPECSGQPTQLNSRSTILFLTLPKICRSYGKIMTIFSSDILKGFQAYSLLGSDDKTGYQKDTDNHRISEVPESTPEPLPVATASKEGTIDSYRPGFFSRAPHNNEPKSVPESDPRPIRTRGPDSKPRGQNPEPISTRGQPSQPMSIQDQLPVKQLGTSRPSESLQGLGTRVKKEEPGLMSSGRASQLSNQQTRDQQSSSNKGPGSQQGQEEKSGVHAWHSLLSLGAKEGNGGKSTGKTRLQGRIVQKGLLPTGKFLPSFSFLEFADFLAINL